jgi:hypothetical protein
MQTVFFALIIAITSTASIASAADVKPNNQRIAILLERLAPTKYPTNASRFKMAADTCNEYKSCDSAADCCPSYPRCDTVNGSGPTVCMLKE